MNKNYREYLKSNEWKEIKSLVLKRDGNKCIKCGSSNSLQIHHTTYVNIFNEAENLDDLITLCGRCHMEEHNIESISDDFYVKVENDILMNSSFEKPSSMLLYFLIIKMIQSGIYEYDGREYIIPNKFIKKFFYRKTIQNKSMENIICDILENNHNKTITHMSYDKKNIYISIEQNTLELFCPNSNYSIIDLSNYINRNSTNIMCLMNILNRYKNTGFIIIKDDKIRHNMRKIKSSKSHFNRDMRSCVNLINEIFKINMEFKTKESMGGILYEFTFNKFKNTIGGVK